ncbi:MAG: preprotein translocase subunit SecG [Pseudomonadota bacterium]
MWLQLVNVLYVLVAIAMIALILMQRGAGAQAGSGFGGGASATVFGSRGASNFLTKSTKWLAILFFTISLGMAYYATHSARVDRTPTQSDLGVMGQAAPVQVQEAPDTPVPTAPAQQPASPVAVPQYVPPAPPADTATPAPAPAPAQGQ